MTNLQQQFHDEMMAGIETTKRDYGYNPTYFLQMIHIRGAVIACKILLTAPQSQEGLVRLYNLGRPDLTMEAQVCDPKYNSLFTEEERAIARKRLRDLGYERPRRSG